MSFLPTDPIFATQDGRQALYNTILNQGTRYLQKQQFDQAVAAFRRASAYSPTSSDPFMLMGKTYEFMGDSKQAIASFEKAVKVDPTNTDARNSLAFAYVKANRYDDAEREFQRMLARDATDAGTMASLGHVYLATGRVEEAEARFRKAIQLNPRDPAAYYSLGLALNAKGRYADAIEQFQRAVALRPDYAAAFADMAHAYVGLGDTGNAQLQASRLDNLNTRESAQLAEQVRLEMITPKIAYAVFSKSDFDPLGGPNTQVAWLDPALATPGATKVFRMVFRFNQAMDPASVRKTLNWSIRQATGGKGGVYGNGVVLQMGRQVSILPVPLAVTYDPVTFEATVSFRVSQNATGDGLIDPMHWVFRFMGTDTAGNPIDPTGDQWDGRAQRSF